MRIGMRCDLNSSFLQYNYFISLPKVEQDYFIFSLSTDIWISGAGVRPRLDRRNNHCQAIIVTEYMVCDDPNAKILYEKPDSPRGRELNSNIRTIHTGERFGDNYKIKTRYQIIIPYNVQKYKLPHNISVLFSESAIARFIS